MIEAAIEAILWDNDGVLVDTELLYFRANRDAFQAAADAKILREAVAPGVNFHLTSRDVARQIKK